MRLTGKIAYTLAAALLMMMASGFQASGQINNRLGVDDAVFQMYARASAFPMNGNNMSTADSLYRLGTFQNDPKIKALALAVVIQTQYALGEYDEMDKAMAELRDIYNDHPEIDSFYFQTVFSYCQCLLVLNRQQEAFMCAHSLVRKAETLNDAYGRMTAYRVMAYIYDARLNPLKAVSYFEMAADECVNNNVSVLELASIYGMIAFDYIELGEYGKSAEYLAKVEPYIEDSITLKGQYLFIMLKLAFTRHDYGGFMHAYAVLQDFPYNKYVLDAEDRNSVETWHAIMTQNYQDALVYAKSIGTDHVRHELLARIYHDCGDYESAFAEVSALMNWRDSLARIIQDEDIAAMDVELKNADLRAEANQLRLKMHENTVTGMFVFGVILMFFLVLYALKIHKHNIELGASNAGLETAKQIAEDALDEARMASEAESRFLQNMSHEIRTPLNAVLGFAQVLSLPDDFLTIEERQEYVSYVQNNAELLLMIVNDMIAVSDVEKGEFKLKIADARIADICRKTIKAVEHRVPKGVSLIYKDGLPQDFTARTDVLRVQQLLLNLLTNSCKNTASGSITLESSLNENGEVVLSVTDTGCGIPEESIPHIFERFYKVDANKQGAGLGLYICAKIARSLGGSLKLDTSFKGGARFCFICPPLSVEIG